jgi:hypothetical protein
MRITAFAAALTLGLAACGGGDVEETVETGEEVTEVTPAAPEHRPGDPVSHIRREQRDMAARRNGPRSLADLLRLFDQRI